MGTNQRIFIGSHWEIETDPDSINLNRSWHQNWNPESPYFTVYDSTDQSIYGPFTWIDKWMFVFYSPQYSNLASDKIYNVFLLPSDSLMYLAEAFVFAEDEIDFYFRKNITDPWINLDSIKAEIELDPTYLGPIFDPLFDTIVNEDGYIFSYQIMMKPEADFIDNIGMLSLDPKIQISYSRDAVNVNVPMDRYNVILYDISGRVIYRDQFNGQDYNLSTQSLNNGIYIYTLEGRDNTFSGKFYK